MLKPNTSTADTATGMVANVKKTGRYGSPRQRRTTTLLASLALTAALTAGCTPTAVPTAAVPPPAGSGAGAPTGATSATTAPPAGAPSTAPAVGALAAEDPDHTTAQPFPAPGTCHERAVPHGVLPDPTCTPGATYPNVTQATIDKTICRSGGYTATVRPPASVTGTEKKSAMRAYNDTAPTSSYELDHLVSLELGGSPNSPRNLWPQPAPAPNPKDKLEGALHDLVCSHRMTLVDAQNAIAGDWVAAYSRVLGSPPLAP